MTAGSSPVRVLGYIGDAAPLSDGARRAVAAADLVVGGRRHLDALDVAQDRRVVLGRLDPAIEALTSRGDRSAVVLASGDPGFFGIVRRLRGAGLDLTVEPAPSACSLAFGRMGLSWEDAQIVSAHGRELGRALNVVRAHDRVAVMTTVGAGLREIAAGLDRWPRSLVLLEHLGEPQERIRRFTPEEALALDPADIAEPNVVIALADDGSGAVADGVEPPADALGRGLDVIPDLGASGTRRADPGMPWRLGERGASAWASQVQGDPLSALVVGAFGIRPGDLVAMTGPAATSLGAAVGERGAAVLRGHPRFDPVGTPHGDLPRSEEPDLVCVDASGMGPEGVQAVVDLVSGGDHRPRGLAVVADDADVRHAEEVLSSLPVGEYVCSRLEVPVPVPLAGAGGGETGAMSGAGRRVLLSAVRRSRA